MRHRAAACAIVGLIVAGGFVACSDSGGSSGSDDDGAPTTNREKVEKFCDRYCECEGACVVEDPGEGSGSDGAILPTGGDGKATCVDEYSDLLDDYDDCTADVLADFLACLAEEGRCAEGEGGGDAGVVLEDEGCLNAASKGLGECDGGSGVGGGTGVATIVAAGVGPAGPGVGATTATGPSSPSSTSGGCTPSELFSDATLNACGNQSCCEEMAVCANDITLCVDETGTFDASLPDAEALAACLNAAGCLEAGGICNSGLELPSAPELESCLGANCCDALLECTSLGDDVQSCIDCLNGDEATYDRCEDVNQCAADNCGTGLVFVEVCDSGIGTSNISLGTCLDANCCSEYQACSGDGSEADIQDCLDCFGDGGGALCDDAIECEVLHCDSSICDSGLAISTDLELAQCLGANCCEEYTACTGSGSNADVQDCIDCFNADGGPLCDAAIACGDASCDG